MRILIFVPVIQNISYLDWNKYQMDILCVIWEDINFIGYYFMCPRVFTIIS